MSDELRKIALEEQQHQTSQKAKMADVLKREELIRMQREQEHQATGMGKAPHEFLNEILERAKKEEKAAQRQKPVQAVQHTHDDHPAHGIPTKIVQGALQTAAQGAKPGSQNRTR